MRAYVPQLLLYGSLVLYFHSYRSPQRGGSIVVTEACTHKHTPTHPPTHTHTHARTLPHTPEPARASSVHPPNDLPTTHYPPTLTTSRTNAHTQTHPPTPTKPHESARVTDRPTMLIPSSAVLIRRLFMARCRRRLQVGKAFVTTIWLHGPRFDSNGLRRGTWHPATAYF